MRTSTSALSSAPAATLPAVTRSAIGGSAATMTTGRTPERRPTDTDPELLARIRQYLGEADKDFRKLWDRYKGKVLEIAKVALPGEADDIVQMVFDELWKSMKSYAAGDSFDRKVELVARRVIREYKQRQNCELREGNEELIACLDSAIAILTPLDRTIVTSHFLEGRSFEDIAKDVVIMRPNRIHRRYVRAVAKLRDHLRSKTLN